MSRRVPLPTAGAFTDQPRGFDLLSLPGLRRFLRWRYARLVFQIPLLVLAIFVIVDGLTGRQLAPRNVATTASWLHYRGLVVVALALIGNAFCAACPLMLTRGPANAVKRLLGRERRWPSWLRSKWLVIVLLAAILVSYEAFGLWASPWLTAWIVIAYFVGAFAIDVLFPAGTFCRYVCPLGNFNFAFASVSPTQIAAVDPEVCRSCEEKPCLHGRETYADPARARGEFAHVEPSRVVAFNGEGRFPGCETRLMVPTMTGSMDCTSCFNCVRACPYDNVGLVVRSPAREATTDAWRRRWGLPAVLLGVLLLWWGLLNAVQMVPPFFDAAAWLSSTLGIGREATLLALIFAAVTALGTAVSFAVSVAADRIGGKRTSPGRALLRWGYVHLVLAFGFWAAHYLFHFLTGAVSIVPVFQHFFEWRGFDVTPNWRLARLVPSAALFPLTAGIASAYALVAAWVAIRIATRDFGRRAALAMWPMLLFVVALAVAQVLILSLPMEMRGTILGPTS